MVESTTLTEEVHAQSTASNEYKTETLKNKEALCYIKVPVLPTYEQLRNAIPPQCFEKSLPTSLAYLIWDYAVIAGLYFALPTVEKYLGWPGLLVWYYVTGMFMSSLFIIGHDCGHTTFSNYTWVNDLCGHLAHAPIMGNSLLAVAKESSSTSSIHIPSHKRQGSSVGHERRLRKHQLD
ncbi:hypothetical protein M3Y98_00780800 [Aphelenchoides besseyi]|nr:hypothetical protein M3Y98_00780800 [Aphelenchoides besseyi]KAI6211835.1 hypothetical protein M3Y96_00476400 [Aphelenchoides besseyi]